MAGSTFSQAWTGGEARVGRARVTTEKMEVIPGSKPGLRQHRVGCVLLTFPDARSFGASNVKHELTMHPEVTNISMVSGLSFRVEVRIDAFDPEVLRKIVDVIAGALNASVISCGSLAEGRKGPQ